MSETNNIISEVGPAGSDSEPVTAQELYDHLQLNCGLAAVQTQLEDFITSARLAFEVESDGRIVIPTVYTQHLTEWPDSGVIRLQRGPVQEVASVTYYDEDDTLQELDAEADLTGTPAIVYTSTFSYPALSTTKVRPVTVEFTAGMDTVPADIKLAIKLLAAHWYLQREAFSDTEKKEVPMGFARVCDRYKTGLRGW